MKKTYSFTIFLSILLLLFFNSLTAQTIGLISNLSGNEEDGYVLFAPQYSDTTYLMDKCGKLVHTWASNYMPGLDVYLLQDGSLLRTGHVANHVFDPPGGSAGGIIQRYDWNGNLLWQYILSDSMQTQNHDICYMPNGNILLAVWEVISDSEAIANGRKPSTLGANLWVAKVIEIQPVGTDSANIVWSWRVWDHLIQDYDSTKLNYGVVADHPELLNLNYIDTTVYVDTKLDWLHLNQVIYNPNLDQVMISAHNLNEIWIIDHSTDSNTAAAHTGGVHHKGGDFLYRWGNPAAYNRGTLTDKKLFQQHDPEWITSGKYVNQIRIFNNGNGRFGGNASSVDIINPPVDSEGNYHIADSAAYGPGSLTWTYETTPPSNFYTAYEGGAQTLPNGNTLICQALQGILFETDTNKNIVWKYINPVNNGQRAAQGANPTILTKNFIYRCTFYQASYSGFAGHTLVPGLPIEKNPLSYTCTTPLGAATVQIQREALEVFPNPANNTINVQSDNINLLELRDITGRVLLHKKFANTNIVELTTAELPDGVYILCINNAQYKQVVIRH